MIGGKEDHPRSSSSAFSTSSTGSRNVKRRGALSFRLFLGLVVGGFTSHCLLSARTAAIYDSGGGGGGSTSYYDDANRQNGRMIASAVGNTLPTPLEAVAPQPPNTATVLRGNNHGNGGNHHHRRRRHQRQELGTAFRMDSNNEGVGNSDFNIVRSAAYCDLDILGNDDNDPTEFCYFQDIFLCNDVFYLPTAKQQDDNHKHNHNDYIRVCKNNRCWPDFMETVHRVTPDYLNQVCHLKNQQQEEDTTVTTIAGTTAMLDVHWNVGHNMLDKVFPVWYLMRHFDITDIQHVTWHGQFTDSGGIKYESRTNEQRKWAMQLFNDPDSIDLQVLCGDKQEQGGSRSGRTRTSACRFSGLLMGIGGLGLSTPDRQNHFGGAYVNRALFQYRQTVQQRFASSASKDAATTTPFVPKQWQNTSTEGGGGRRKLKVVWCTNKRRVKHLQYVFKAMDSNVFVLDWSRYSFQQHADILRNADIVWTGVGTSQMSLYMMRPGSVAIQIGRPTNRVTSHVDYFDATLLNSLDHVRTLWLPAYSAAPATPAAPAVLELKLVRQLMRQAESLVDNYVIPIPKGENSNWVDRAYSRLVQLEPRVHLDRINNCATSSPLDLFVPKMTTRRCAWESVPLQESIRDEFPEIRDIGRVLAVPDSRLFTRRERDLVYPYGSRAKTRMARSRTDRLIRRTDRLIRRSGARSPKNLPTAGF